MTRISEKLLFSYFCVFLGQCKADLSLYNVLSLPDTTNDTMTVTCKYIIESKIKGVCAYLGETCSADVFRSGTTRRKQIPCQCLVPVMPSVIKQFYLVPRKFTFKRLIHRLNLTRIYLNMGDKSCATNDKHRVTIPCKWSFDFTWNPPDFRWNPPKTL